MTIASTWKKSMPVKPRVLIDLNVILDVLQRREPFYATSARVLACAEADIVEGWVAAHSLTTLFYLLAKYQSVARARVTLSELLSFLLVAAVDQAVIEQALNLPYHDFEDAVQMMAAVRSGVDYLVTRNVQDYASGPLPALQPAELLPLV
jgi:predicted nucleic acid-binding protein